MSVNEPEDIEPLPPLKPFNGRCNARARQRRGYCKAGSTSPNGRCHYHGGPTPRGIASANYMTGKTSKYHYLPLEDRSRLDSLTGDVLDRLEESIDVQTAYELRLVSRIDSGESAQCWALLKDEMKDWREEDVESDDRLSLALSALEQIETIITKGAHSYAVQQANTKELQSIHESQRKLTETLTKCRKEVQETYTREEWNMFLASVLLVLKANVEGHLLAKMVGQLEARSVPVLDAVTITHAV